MSDGHPRFWHQRGHVSGDMFDIGHSVVDEKDLAFSQQLAADRFGDRTVVVRTDEGEDRLTTFWWRVDQREVTNAGQTEFKSSGNRCGGQREHVHRRTELLDAFLVLNPEPLLLVDDQQT